MLTSILRSPWPPSGSYRIQARTIPDTRAVPSRACRPVSIPCPHTSTMRAMSGQASGTMLSSVSSWHRVTEAAVS